MEGRFHLPLRCYEQITFKSPVRSRGERGFTSPRCRESSGQRCRGRLASHGPRLRLALPPSPKGPTASPSFQPNQANAQAVARAEPGGDSWGDAGFRHSSLPRGRGCPNTRYSHKLPWALVFPGNLVIPALRVFPGEKEGAVLSGQHLTSPSIFFQPRKDTERPLPAPWEAVSPENPCPDGRQEETRPWLRQISNGGTLYL